MNGLKLSKQLSSAILLLLGLSILQGCAGLRPGYEMPTLTVKSFRALPTQGAIPDFEIGLHVINPNGEALNLRGVSYTISLGGYDLIKGVANQLPVIEGYGQGDLMLTGSANLIAGIRLVNALITRPGDTVPYEFSAKLDVGAWRPAIRVKDGGVISLQGEGGNNAL